MDLPKLLTIGGLTFDFAGSLVLVLSFLFPRHFVDDDYILKMDVKTGKYFQKKHLKDRTINLVGFMFLSVGFLFQFIAFII